MRSLRLSCLLLPLLLQGCTEANPGYVPEAGPTCTPGVRTCSGSNLMVCVAGTEPKLEVERMCPAPSSCQEGACVPTGQTCQGTCPNPMVCTVFVAPGTTRLVTYCAQPTGARAGGLPCSRGDDCQTGICVSGGKTPVCYRSCGANRDCPAALRCIDAKITVNGVGGTVPACVP